MKNNQDENNKKIVIIRIAACCGIVLIGLFLMTAMAKFKKPPEKATPKEKPLNVEVISAVREDIKTLITGYGEVKALNSVSIAPEISGKVTFIHPNLEVGGLIKKGDTIFKIDPADYINNVDTYKKRLKNLKRIMVLSKKEYMRTKNLYKKSNTGSLSDVEKAEQTYKDQVDQVDQIENSLKTALLNLQRCTVNAPFDARVSSVSLEEGQYVTTGTSAVTLSDDSVLEVEIPVGSIEAQKYLSFNDKKDNSNIIWFNSIEKKQCDVIWTGDQETKSKGTINRVIKYDSSTRTVYLAVRILATEESDKPFPIVDGMFVEVQIPGKTIKDAIRIPRDSISFDETVYISHNNKLKTVSVKVTKTDDDYVIISSGINEGDLVITSKLISPLENASLSLKEKKLFAQTKGEK